jgi:hypothetical protein
MEQKRTKKKRKMNEKTQKIRKTNEGKEMKTSAKRQAKKKQEFKPKRATN